MEKDGYGGRSRRLKQVWALQTEEAVQSSECFEWKEILSSGVCACLSFIFKLVCCQFSHSFWKHFENVLTWTIQNWILLREIISLKNFSLHFHNQLKSIWHIYCYLFSCLELQRQVCIFISLLMLGCFFFYSPKSHEGKLLQSNLFSELAFAWMFLKKSMVLHFFILLVKEEHWVSLKTSWLRVLGNSLAGLSCRSQ